MGDGATTMVAASVAPGAGAGSIAASAAREIRAAGWSVAILSGTKGASAY